MPPVLQHLPFAQLLLRMPFFRTNATLTPDHDSSDSLAAHPSA
jgi:hypothetical protein